MRRSAERRRRIGFGAAAVVAGLTAVLAQTPTPMPPATGPQTPPMPTPRFRAEADVVVVEATILDKKGVVVTGLGPADFRVEIGGKLREVVSVDMVDYATPSAPAAADAPPAELEITTNEPKDNGRVILLLVDQGSLRTESRAVINAAREWVMSLGPKDLVGLMTFPLPGPRLEFTKDHAKLADMLTRVTGIGTPPLPFHNRNVSIWEAFRIEAGDSYIRSDVVARECRGEPLCAPEVDMQAKTMAMDAQAVVQPVLRNLRAMVRALEVIPGPKHAVLLSSGWPIREADAATELGFVAEDAARSNVILHTFTAEMWALAASRSRPSMRSIEDQNLLLNSVEMLSSLTGGRAIRLTGNAAPAFAALNSGLSGYYRLGVQALPDDLDGKTHRIGLKVSRPGATVASYRRILAATRAQPAVAIDPQTLLRDALKGGPPQTTIGLRATSYVLHATSSARDLRVVAVGDVSRASAGSAKAVAALYDLDGRPVTAMENTVDVPASGPGQLSIELTAPPGTYVLRVAVLDAEGHVGSLERLVDAHWKKAGAVETPGLVLFRSDRAARTEPRPVFDHVTAADELIAQVPLAGPVAEKKTQVVFEVARLGGTAPLVRRTGRIAQTTGGTTVAQETMPASMLPPGRYTLSAQIGSGSGSGSGSRQRRRRGAHAHVHRDGGTGRDGHRHHRRHAGRIGRAGGDVGRRCRLAHRHVVVRQAALLDIDRARAQLRDAGDRSAGGTSGRGGGARRHRAIEGRPVADRQRQGSARVRAARGQLRRRPRPAAGRRHRGGRAGLPRRAQDRPRLRAGADLPRRLLRRRGQGSGGGWRLADGARPRAHVARAAAAGDRGVAARRQAGGGAGLAQPGPAALARRRRVRPPAGAGRPRRRPRPGRARPGRAAEAARSADAAAGADHALRRLAAQDTGVGRGPRRRDDAYAARVVRVRAGRIAGPRRCLAERDGEVALVDRIRTEAPCLSTPALVAGGEWSSRSSPWRLWWDWRRRRRRSRPASTSSSSRRRSSIGPAPSSPISTPADFAVEIDGARREVVSADFVRHGSGGAGAESIVADPDITSNTAAAAGRTIIIAVDHISLRSQSRDVLQTAKAWVATLGPTDRVGLMALPPPGVNVELTTDHARVMQALDTDLETMRRLRDAYAAARGESLPLVDAWLKELGATP